MELRIPGIEEWILLFHLFFLLPGIIGLTFIEGKSRYPFRIAACSTALAMFLKPGLASAALTIPTIAGSMVSFAHGFRLLGLRAFADRGRHRLSHACMAAGLMYLPVGTGFLFAFRAGLNTGYSDAITSLTSVHFHYAAFSTSILAGFITRAMDQNTWPRFQPLLLLGVMTGPAVTGIGIALGSRVELFASLYMTVFASALAFTWIFRVTFNGAGVRRSAGVNHPNRLRAYLGVSSICLLMAMALASTYAIRPDLGAFPWIYWMIRTHGILNSAGFVVPATIAALYCLGPLPPFQAVLSRLTGKLTIGKDSLNERFLEQTPGLLSLDDFASPQFSPRSVHATIRDFYLRTSEYTMTVQSRWLPGFRLAGRLFKSFSRKIGQINFPEHKVRRQTHGRLFRASPDNRGELTAWVRTYVESPDRKTESCLYAALYAKMPSSLVNIAMIMPGGNLTSILRFSNDAHDGLILSSIPEAEPDTGIYFVLFGRLALRLPMDESFHLVADNEHIRALHSMELFGYTFLTLDFEIAKANLRSA